MWSKNGNQLSLMPGELSGQLGMTLDNDLVFNNIAYSDAGTYVCKATNLNGEAQKVTRVQVIRKCTFYDSFRVVCFVNICGNVCYIQMDCKF